MSPSNVTPAPTLDDNNQAFYQWLLGLVFWVQQHYRIMLFPSWVQESTPGVNSSNPEQVDDFYLLCPQYPKYGPIYMSQQYRFIFGDDYASVAAILFATMANSVGQRAPQPISQSVAVGPAPPPTPPSNPVGASILIDDGTVQYVDLGSPNVPVGGTVKNADGVFQKFGRAMVVGYRTWFVKMAALLLLLFAAGQVRAQVTIACSPQPMAATRSIGEKVMGPYQCWITNDGTAAYTLTPSKFFQAILALRPVGPNLANQIITDSVNGLAQSKFIRVAKIGASLGAIGYGIYSGNATVPLAVSAGLQYAPQAISIIEGTVPSAAPFSVNQFTSPVTIPPGGDVPNGVVVYAMKTKTPAPLTVVVK